MQAMRANARSLEREITWFEQVLECRFHHYFVQPDKPAPEPAAPPPDLADDPSVYAQTVRRAVDGGMSADERMVLLLALLPHLRPQVLDLLLTHNKLIERPFTEFGGLRGNAVTGLLPTCETAVFILAGDDLQRRFEVMRLFEAGHFFAQQGMLKIVPPENGEPALRAALAMETDYLNRFTNGQHHKPDFGAGFPAKLITTSLAWDDLVVAPEVLDDIEQIRTWLHGGRQLLQDWGLERMVKPGYRTLFYGPPGTGKTLTATLLGQSAGVDVYRIDLSMLVSKYIGETEKNLASVFDQAQNKNWILFFDEADALFGKRTEGSTSNDRHANQEIAYLLQRVEDFPGVVILATNLKSNLDEAFSRRFQSAIYFPLPDALQRARLWRQLFPDPARLAPDVDLADLADKHVLSGGALANVARYAAIRAARRHAMLPLQPPPPAARISADDLLRGIKKEFIKEGRTL
ncbi:ATP-binding protein [Janthinobacterium sp. BJB1]|uniref:ATP-binding protein n=2 Tax=Janthinobacterium sp. GW458P TaxID=1981504 RepID=UPI000A3201EB|nr:ATP-binding protein [Janthinobacterium sp. GW458P]MBE3024378.1 ATP-binding protein [Janthinobacterium sp. GW458P]PHV15154.1 ATP-binding protein [Janthinobacterium sp. BJB303]PJC98167.1 ATP-binding protein [Janthinobacterium sp. BJB1]